MAKRNGIRYREIYIFLFFTTLAFVGDAEQSDWIAEMEDAFATDNKQSGMMCKRNPSDKWMFCRYQNDERTSLSKLSPCLCTHIVFDTELNQQVPTILRNLKLAYGQVEFLPSVAINKEELQNTSKLIKWLDKQLLNGIDIRIEKEDYLDDITWSKFFKYLEEIVGYFNEKEKEWTLSTTIKSNVLPHMKDSQLLEISSFVDFISYPPEPQELLRQDMVQKLSRIEKIESVKAKLLTVISLRDSFKDATKKNLTNERYPEMCKYLDLQTDEPTAANISHALPERQFLLETIKKQVQFEDGIESPGIDIWSLNDDDSQGICGNKPFPIISAISSEIKGERKVFDSFADLDIVLSTGESQLDEIQVLQPHTDPEQIRKFKCDRIGFYRHPSDCTKFYHCAEHRPTSAQASSQHAVFVYKCPSGLVYDELQGSCNWPSHSEPCQGSDELLPVPPKKFLCTIPGFHVDPEDCRWFYYCSDLGDGRLAAFEFLCPSHLLGFDEQQLLCNWKWMVPTCGNSQSAEKREYEKDYDKTEPGVKVIDVVNARGINNNRILKILDSVTTFTPKWDTFTNSEILNVPLELGLKSDNLNAPVRNRMAMNYLAAEDLERKGNFSSNLSQQDKLINNETIRHSPLRNVENTTEKKYGTAFWHRSMANNKPSTIQRSRFESFLNDLRLRNNNSESLESVKQNDEIKIDHKYGIGTVKRISTNSHMIPNNVLNPSSNSHQGRSLGDIVATSYHFENTLNDEDIVSQQKPYSQVKCDKLKNKNKEDEVDGSDDNFGCVGEVSLTIRVKEGKEFDKYILKPNQITSSAIQESEQVPVVTNHTTDTRNLKNQNLQEKNSENLAPQHNVVDNEKEIAELDKLHTHTQGRSASNDRTFNAHQIHSDWNKNEDPVYLNTDRNQTKLVVPLTANNPNEQYGTLNRKSHITNNNYDRLEKKIQSDNITLVRVPRTKHFKHSSDEKNKMMPLFFFPEGVLLNVDINQMNEIPPQILLEVDNMLKRYMDDGNIDLNLLMEKLNATAEPMSDIVSNDQNMRNEMDHMLDVLENILNSTDGIQLNSVFIMNNTEKIVNTSELVTTIENYTDPNDFHLPYENITNYAEMSDIIKEEEKSLNSSSDSVNTDLGADSKIPGIRKNILIAEKILDVPENKPFVRRRLFRKHKFPSIREQLELQNRLAQSKKLENSSHYETSTTITEAPILMANHRHRYPSIRQQLFLNNKRRISINARSNVIWKRLEEMHFEKDALVNNPQDYNTSVRLHHLGDSSIDLKSHRLDYNKNDLKTRHLSINDAHLQPHQPEKEYTDIKAPQLEDAYGYLKNHEFGDRIRPTSIDLSFSSHPQTSTIDRVHNHGKPILENSRDTSFLSLPKDNGIFPEKPKIHPIHISSNRKSENENNPTITNEHSHRKSLHEDRYRYTFPLSPQRKTDYLPTFSFSEKPNNEENMLHRSASEPTIRDYPDNTRETAKLPRKSRKLRILVKKRRPDVNNNDNFPNAHSDVSNTDQHQKMRMRIPKKLLNDLKTNVLRKLALDGKSEVKLQIQFQDHVWNVPFVNEKSSVDISPFACTRPGLFQHPKDCNMFYECFWDKWLQRFTLHVFSCPVRLVYDDSIRGCSRPSFESHCRNSLDNS